MASWAKICDILKKYANRDNEMAYQKSIIDLLLETNLDWHKTQIDEQMSMRLGSTERLIPDVVMTKDARNKFVMEVKEPAHCKTQINIDQLVSYMKQLETPVGIYVGKELEVYYKNLGDGSEPKMVMSLKFDPREEQGEDFISLFSEASFSIESVQDYLKEHELKKAFDTNVENLVSHLLSTEFNDELKQILISHFSDKENDVVKAALDAVTFIIKPVTHEESFSTPYEVAEPIVSASKTRIRRKGGNNGVAQRYAYNLIKGIIEKNPNLNFRSLYDIFGYKNYIEDIKNVKDETRWCMDEDDIIKIADGTNVVISNQWGFNNNSKTKMDRLRETAKRYGLDITLP